MNELQIYRIVFWAWLAIGAASFVGLFFRPAPYGRHAAGQMRWTIDATWGWVLMEFPAVVIFGAFYWWGRDRTSAAALAFLVLWQAHYLHRSLVYPFRRRGTSRRTPLWVVVSAVLFHIVNGYLNGRDLFALSAPYPAGWLADPRFLAGTAMFLAGMAINIHADTLLMRLRAPGGGEYRIPQGGFFRFVSCPNYFGELLEWAGWAVLTWSPGGLAFALWTFFNLAPRALTHHRWYREKFADYPPRRRALVPFVI